MCKHDDGCNVPEGECSGACMTQQTSSETLDQLCERYPAVKALREENERLNSLAKEYFEKMNEWRHGYESIESKLPDGMKHCTILFNECYKGHGWLTATNWVQHNCPTCERHSLESQLAELRQGGEAVAVVGGGKTFQDLDWLDNPPQLANGTLLYTRPQPAIPPGYAVVQVEPNKAALIGEFSFPIEHVCDQCPVEGDCEVCDGSGLYLEQKVVPWTTIKEIIAAHIASAPAIQPQAAAPSVPVAEKVKETPDEIRIAIHCLEIPEHKKNDTDFLRASCCNALAHLRLLAAPADGKEGEK